MSFDRECILFAGPLAALSVLFLALGLFTAGAVMLALLAFVMFFFRDPERIIPEDEDLIVAPADGRVIRVDTAYSNPEFPDGAVCVSIFLSIFNVHVQRTPIAGTVDSKRYNTGSFLAAWDHKASEENEYSLSVLDTRIGKVGVKQIAGLVARRVITRINVGQTVAKGEHIGVIRFGSRVDLILPPGASLISKEGDKVKGGATVMARINYKGGKDGEEGS